jgi:glycosyltransferase involved in cell wall biosynthesis
MSSRKVASIVTYAQKNAKHSSFSALAGYTKNLLENLPLKDRQEHIVFSNIKTDGYQAFIEDGIEVVECWQRDGFWFFWQIFTETGKHKNLKLIHLQHEFNMFGGTSSIAFIPVLLILLKWFRGLKIVAMMHEVVDPKMVDTLFVKANNIRFPVWLTKALFWSYFKFACLFIDQILVHDDYFKKVLQNSLKVKNKITVVYHGIEDFPITITKEQAMEKLNLKPNKRNLLFLGFLAGYKGLDLLIDGFGKLTDKQNYTLIIAGGKPKRVAGTKIYEDWYESLVKRARQFGDIRFVGFVKNEDLETYFKATDVLILPYLIPQSMSGILCMAVGFEKPFIAADSFAGRLPQEFLFGRSSTELAKKIEDFYQSNSSENLTKIILELKQERLWSKIALQTSQIYHQYL